MARRRIKYAMILVAVIAVPVGGYFGYQWVVHSNERDRCKRNLKELAMAVSDYENKNGRFPPAYVNGKDGKPWHSWRVLILPFLGRQDLYDAYHFDEPWDGPNNSKLIDQMPAVFACPADRGKPVGKTSYVAIVGSQSAWPGDRSPMFREITDGSSNTILFMESTSADVTWTQPRDVTVAELFPPDNDDIGPQFSSKHDDYVAAAFCDGHVSRLPLSQFRSGDGRRRLLGFVTAYSGRPYDGKWLPGEQSVVAAEFPPEVIAEKLSATDVVAHLHGRTTPERNMVWCATMQIAWDEMRQTIGAAPQVRNNEIADGLAKTAFPRSALDPASYVSKMGAVGDGIKQAVAEEMGRKFPGVAPPSLTAEEPSDVIIFGFLQKNLPFDASFDSLRDPLTFHAPRADVNVKSFGFKTLKEAKRPAATLTPQIRILDYRSDDDFIIQLNSKFDEIVLAKVEPGATLAHTVAAVKNRIAADGKARPQIEDDETLIVPNLAFNVLKDFQTLKGEKITNFQRGEYTCVIREAKQSVRFMLNERGAKIESAIEVYEEFANGHQKPPKPRKFVLDRPFLLAIQETKAAMPYFVMWVANDEIMQRFDAK